MRNERSQAFSVPELLTCLTIVSLLAVSSQNLLVLSQGQRLKDATLNIYSLIQLSRAHALSHNTRVTLCSLTSTGDCSTQWSADLSAFADPNGNRKLDNSEQQIRMIDLPNELEVKWKGMGSGSNLHFNSQGQTFVANGTFTLGLGDQTRQLTLNRQGKPKISL